MQYTRTVFVSICFFTNLHSFAAAIGSGAALIDEIIALKSADFERFMMQSRNAEQEKTLEKQFDAMMEHLKTLDREAILELADRAFENGWPSHIIAFLFGEAMAESFGERMVSHKQTMVFLEAGKLTQARKVFAIQFAQRKWMNSWGDGEYAQFAPCIVDFVLDVSNSFDLRMAVADDFAKSMLKRLHDGNNNETMRHVVGKALEMALCMLRGNEDARFLASNARHAMRLYGAIRGKPQLNSGSDESWRLAVVRILKNPETAPPVAEEILHAQETLALADLLGADDVARMKSDKRLASAECQKALDLIQQKIAARSAAKPQPPNHPAAPVQPAVKPDPKPTPQEKPAPQKR